MGVRVPEEIKGLYSGGMNQTQYDLLMEIRNSKCVPAMKNTIFKFPTELVVRSAKEGRSIRDICKDENIDFHPYIGELRDYQTLGSAFMYFSPRSMIADGVGLGKTVEVASLINYLKFKGQMKRFLMAVEITALGQTQYEMIRMTGLNIISLPSESAKLTRALKNTDWNKVDGIVVSHTILRSDTFSRFLARNVNEDGTCRVFDVFLNDESSFIKNKKTKIYDYTYNICQLAKRVHFMNATAFENCLKDVYYQLDMMNPALLPEESKINGKYTVYERGHYFIKGKDGKPQRKMKFDAVGYKNQSEFKEKLQLVYFGRCKKDVGLDRPNIYKVYRIMPTQMQAEAINAGHRYNEVLNCPSLIPDIKIPTDRKNVPKIDRLIDLVESEFSDSKVMVFVFHREAQKRIFDELVKIGRKPVILNGETEQEDRFQIQNDFNNGVNDVIITNVKKSLNLHGGDVCIFYSVLTNPASMFQAAGRIDRNVDDKIKTFVLLLYEKTPELDYFTSVTSKRAQDARDLTIDAETTVDFFIKSMQEEEE